VSDPLRFSHLLPQSQGLRDPRDLISHSSAETISKDFLMWHSQNFGLMGSWPPSSNDVNWFRSFLRSLRPIVMLIDVVCKLCHAHRRSLQALSCSSTQFASSGRLLSSIKWSHPSFVTIFCSPPIVLFSPAAVPIPLIFKLLVP